MDVKITVINVGNAGDATSQALLNSVVTAPKELINLPTSEELRKATLHLQIAENNVCVSKYFP